jgi:Zn-dependent protease with chaperone function
MRFAQALTIVVLLLVLVLMISPTGGLAYVRSPHDGEQYIVYMNTSDRAEAAEAMSIINQRVTALAAYLKRTAPYDRVTVNILENFNPDRIAEITPENAFGYTSYTLDRGKSMRFCLRDKKTLGLHEVDELTFVAYHELAHVADWDSDHDTPFWQVFKYLLQAAARGNIYKPVDYARRPMTYCGMYVEYNPYFDDGLTAYTPSN